MKKTIIRVGDDLYEYILSVSLREPEILKSLRKETAKDPHSSMQISPDQGQFMGLLLKLMGALQVVEIGTYTGYSALCMALSLPAAGGIITCDLSRKWTAIAEDYWQKAGVDHMIDLRLGDALETLDAMIEKGESGGVDFVFIDADKEKYEEYYERALTLLRPGGLIAIDNVLWSGAVLDKSADDTDTRAIDALNRKLKLDERVDISLVPIGDGLTLARKR